LANENVRDYAARTIAEARSDAQKHACRMRPTAAWDKGGKSHGATQHPAGAAFDTAFAKAQFSVMTDAEAHYYAYWQNDKNGPLRRYAQLVLPNAQLQLEVRRHIAGGRRSQRPKILGMRGVGIEMLGIGTCGNF
jgi:hypothetical protein